MDGPSRYSVSLQGLKTLDGFSDKTLEVLVRCGFFVVEHTAEIIKQICQETCYQQRAKL